MIGDPDPCPHGVPYGCRECRMRKDATVAAALALLPSTPPPADDRIRVVNMNGKAALLRGGTVIVADLERATKLLPRMLNLLREIEADFTAGDWRAEIRALLAEIDG